MLRKPHQVCCDDQSCCWTVAGGGGGGEVPGSWCVAKLNGIYVYNSVNVELHRGKRERTIPVKQEQHSWKQKLNTWHIPAVIYSKRSSCNLLQGQHSFRALFSDQFKVTHTWTSWPLWIGCRGRQCCQDVGHYSMLFMQVEMDLCEKTGQCL